MAETVIRRCYSPAIPETVARVKLTGTHRGEFMGVPPAGTRVEVLFTVSNAG